MLQMAFEAQMGPGQHRACEQRTAHLFCTGAPSTEEPLRFLRDSIWLLNSCLTGAFPSSPVYFKMTGRTKIPFN